MTTADALPAPPVAPAHKPRAPRTRPVKRRPDPVTAFAEQALDGRIIVGTHVRHACERHFRDLRDGAARGLKLDLDRVEHVIGYFRNVLRLNGGDFEGAPFDLLPWQQFVQGSAFGWINSRDNTRRFRVVYIETAKGSGKSPLAAGTGLYGLTADGESRAEVYATATKKDQAMVLFRDAVIMYDHSPALQQRLIPSGSGAQRWNLAYPSAGSFFRPLANDDGQSGPRVHMGLLDEYHEHKTSTMLEMLRAGTKSRRQAMIYIITNSGAGKTTPCGLYHDYAAKVAAGAEELDPAETDTFFSFVCALDPTDDPFHDETCWPKANPSLQHANLPGIKYLREQVNEARGMPSKESLVRRLNFCQWTEAEAPWLTREVWAAAARTYTLEQFRGRRAYAGLDLSSTTDLTGLVLAIEPVDPGEPWHLIPYAFLPAEDLARREEQDRVPYTAWKRDGYLITTPGRAVSKLHVLKHLTRLRDVVDIVLMAFDRWRIEDLRQLAADNDIELPELRDFGQGFKDMSPAIDTLETGLLHAGPYVPPEPSDAPDDEPAAPPIPIVHPGHPILTWCASNAVPVTDPADNRKLDKSKAIGRIDLIIAAVMAIGIAGKVDFDPEPQIITIDLATAA